MPGMRFDWKHGQIMTAGGEYGGDPFPWFKSGGPSHSLGGFAFWSNDTWKEGGKTWQGIEDTVDPGRGYAQANVPAADRDPGDQVIPFCT